MAETEQSPLRTWQPVSSGRTLLYREQLIHLADEGKVEKYPLNILRVRDLIYREAGIILPRVLINRFNFGGHRFVYYRHPDSVSFIFAGYDLADRQIDPLTLPFDSAMSVIELARGGSDGYFVGNPPTSNRLIPKAINISGVNKETDLTVAVKYKADYQLIQSPTHPSHTVLNPDADFVCETINVPFPYNNLSPDTFIDATEFVIKNSRGSNNPVVTEGMTSDTLLASLAEARELLPIFPLRIIREILSGIRPLEECPLIIDKSMGGMTGFYVEATDGNVVFGWRYGENLKFWEIQLPEKVDRYISIARAIWPQDSSS